MKTKSIAIYCLLFFAAFNFSHVNAQKYSSPVKAVYDELSGKDGLSAVLITSSMLRFSMSIAAAVSNDAEIDSLKVLVNSMDEIVLLADMSSSAFPDESIKKLENILKKGGYNLMVQMKENNEELNVFMLEDEKSNKIKDLVVIVKENNERMVLSITGNMTPEQLAAVASIANINIGDFIHL